MPTSPESRAGRPLVAHPMPAPPPAPEVPCVLAVLALGLMLVDVALAPVPGLTAATAESPALGIVGAVTVPSNATANTSVPSGVG